MLGSLLEKRLKELRGETILVVMDDDIAFKGKLTDFDRDTMILDEVLQTIASEIDWEEQSGEGTVGREWCGFIQWTEIRSGEVYLRVDHISRIWPGQRSDEDASAQPGHREPIYYRQGPLENTSLGMDITTGMG